jgi:outer membrane murein-binding lipoprotein Lpp
MSYKFQQGAAKLGGAIDATALTGAISPDSMSDGINAVLTAGSALAKTFSDGDDEVTLAVNVDDSSIEVSSDALQVKALGVTNAMLAGSIADSKLNTISTADKVAGSAVQLNANGGLFNDSGLALSASVAGEGLGFSSGVLSLDFSELTDAVLDVTADKLVFRDADGNAARLEDVGHFAGAIAGAGIVESAGQLAVNADDSSIEIDTDTLRVKALGVTNAMLAGSIADAKLNQITTGDKVAGSAVQLAATSSIEDSTGLRLKSTIAGDGLAISSQVLSVSVDDSSIETSAGALQVKALGITNAMLAGSIADSKLNQITTSDKVAGSAVELQSNKGLEDSSGLGVVLKANAGLVVDADGIAVSLSGSTLASNAAGLHLSSSVAGHGLFFGLDQLEVRHSVASLGDSDATLAYGINVQTVDMTAPRSHTLPTPVVAGRTVIVKARNAASQTMTIDTGATGDKIDGVLDSIDIESDGGAVTLMGVANNRWIIV